MAEHTPGPWIIHRRRVTTAIKDAQLGYLVEEVRGRNKEIIQANAFLIAAAPDMLDALREVADVVNDARFTDRIGLGEIVNAAIAKAEGRQ